MPVNVLAMILKLCLWVSDNSQNYACKTVTYNSQNYAGTLGSGLERDYSLPNSGSKDLHAYGCSPPNYQTFMYTYGLKHMHLIRRL